MDKNEASSTGQVIARSAGAKANARSENSNYLEYCEAKKAIQKEVLIEKLMRDSSKRNVQTEKIAPSTLLAQVKSFLPQMKEANDKLVGADKQNVGLEEPSSGDHYVEMNIAVYEEEEED